MLTQDALAPAADVMPAFTPMPAFTQSGTSDALVVVGTIVGIAALVGIGVLYNRWAYGDWTCMFKTCVQSSTKRSRR